MLNKKLGSLKKDNSFTILVSKSHLISSTDLIVSFLDVKQKMVSSNLSQNMYSNGTYLIWFMYYKTLKSSNLNQIDAKTLAMSLTFIWEICLKFKEKKDASWNHFRFWKIKKGLNEKMSKLRLMKYEGRQDEDIMSLGDEEKPLWSKKEGTKTWEMRHEAKFIKFVWKFGTQNLVVTCTLALRWKFGALPKVNLG